MYMSSFTRTYLEDNGLYDKTRLITKLDNGGYAIPIVLPDTRPMDDDSYPQSLVRFHPEDPQLELDPESLLKRHPLLEKCKLIKTNDTNAKRKMTDIESLTLTVRKIIEDIEDLLKEEDKDKMADFLDQLSSIKLYRHTDLITLSKGSSAHPLWDTIQVLYPSLWHTISQSLHCKRIALVSTVKDNGYRSPTTRLVLGDNEWVEHIDNGVKYVFDVTQCMFSAGNITEKIRMSSLNCEGETVVDLYAGK